MNKKEKHSGSAKPFKTNKADTVKPQGGSLMVKQYKEYRECAEEIQIRVDFCLQHGCTLSYMLIHANFERTVRKDVDRAGERMPLAKLQRFKYGESL